MTVFDYITRTYETLADELVYWESVDEDESFTSVPCGWTSNLINKRHRSHKEAIDATLFELRKELKTNIQKVGYKK